LGPHADFIVIAYAATVIVVVGLIVWVFADYRAQRRALAEHEHTMSTGRGPRT
jgi:heme exporter protein D